MIYWITIIVKLDTFIKSFSYVKIRIILNKLYSVRIQLIYHYSYKLVKLIIIGVKLIFFFFENDNFDYYWKIIKRRYNFDSEEYTNIYIYKNGWVWNNFYRNHREAKVLFLKVC